MNNCQATLYQSIRDLKITPPGTALSFEARLAGENCWDLSKAIQVDQEYRKFLFLILEAGHPVTPSDQVDQAWHLHLIYTKSYWCDLCDKIAGRPLHHGPTAGGQREQSMFVDQYAQTKRSYQRFFGNDAPVEFWPEADVRFGEDAYFCRVNAMRNIVLPRPKYRLMRLMKTTTGDSRIVNKESV